MAAVPIYPYYISGIYSLPLAGSPEQPQAHAASSKANKWKKKKNSQAEQKAG